MQSGHYAALGENLWRAGDWPTERVLLREGLEEHPAATVTKSRRSKLGVLQWETELFSGHI